MSFKVLKEGVFTQIQDKGRFSYSNLGVSNSGFLDEYAAFACNKLLENTYDGNLLEIYFGNFIIKANKETKVAITGAFCEFFINDTLYDTWRTYSIKKGDILKIGKIKSGQRVYLGVKNGFVLKKEFGSFSTTIKEDFGKKIENNDILKYKSYNLNFKSFWKKEFLPKYEDFIELRVVLSYQESSFSKKEKEKFFNSIYKITNDSNRMACKLEGEKIVSTLDGIISEGIAFGSIQIPKNGQPIILLKEAQTIGGYPKIGVVLSIDCFKLSQIKAGSSVKFKEISFEEAQEKVKNFYSNFLF